MVFKPIEKKCSEKVGIGDWCSMWGTAPTTSIFVRPARDNASKASELAWGCKLHSKAFEL